MVVDKTPDKRTSDTIDQYMSVIAFHVLQLAGVHVQWEALWACLNCHISVHFTSTYFYPIFRSAACVTFG